MQQTREPWVRSLGREDPLEKEMATHSSIIAWRIPWITGAWRATVHEVARVDDMTEHIQTVQQSDSVIHIHTSIFFRVFSHIGYFRVLSRVPWAIH